MASSNRHWPSLFKSKPCSTHHQWQPDINHSSSLLSNSCQKPPFSSAVNEERTPEPKPRWNPKPEQIRILEAIFNSGMVNPPRDEIRRIRAQLQEYGQVGDANVFYWFQNRKSRSKHKQRQLAGRSPRSNTFTTTTTTTTTSTNPTNYNNSTSHHGIKGFDPSSSSSSSSDRSSGSDKTPPPPPSTSMVSSIIELSASPTPSVNQTLIHGTAHTELSGEHFFFQAPPPPQGYYFSDLLGVVSAPENGLWSDLIGQENAKGGGGDAMDVSEMTTNTAANTITNPVHELQGMGGMTKLMVFINDMVVEVVAGPLNVRQAFGEEAVLLHASGQPVLTDEFGVTLQPLQHGASYYVVNWRAWM